MSTRPLGWTTLEESERLVNAGLDSNTADMMYYQTPQDVLDPNNGVSSFGILLNLYPDFNGLKKNMEQFYSGYNGPVPIFFKPCWSLGKLIDIAKRTQYRASWDAMIQWSVLSPMECVVVLIEYLLNEGYLEKMLNE